MRKTPYGDSLCLVDFNKAVNLFEEDQYEAIQTKLNLGNLEVGLD